MIVLIGLNYLYTLFWYESDIQKHSDLINYVRNVPEDTKVLYIGESSNSNYRKSDFDKRKISDFVSDYYPSVKFADITKPAAHAGIYKDLLWHIPTSSKVETVIVTLNMRSFNAQWIFSNLETSLQKSMMLLQPYPPLMNRLLLSFKAYDIKTEEERVAQFKEKWGKDSFNLPFSLPFKNVLEWDTHLAWNGIKDKHGEYDKENTQLACHYIKGYAFQIDFDKNPRIADFNDIIKLGKERNWKLVFNLLAENYQKADSLIGEELIYMMNQNRERLIEYYSNKGVLVVDNLYAVEDEQFTDQHWTTEHYGEKGRKAVAKGVADSLRKFYPSNYVKANH